jgi:hypothetical protein
MRKATLVAVLFALVLFGSSNAFAGGGPPQKFGDLKMIATNLQTQAAEFAATQEIPSYYENKCEYFNSRAAHVLDYFVWESHFRTKIKATVVRMNWKIKYAKATGDGIMMVPTFKFKRLKAKNKLAQIEAWRAEFLNYWTSTVWQNQHYYCSTSSPENLCEVCDECNEYECDECDICVCEICDELLEPESNLYVWKNSIQPILGGYGTHYVFNFSISNNPVDDDGQGEDAELKYLKMAVHMNSDDYDQLSDCYITDQDGYWLNEPVQPAVANDGSHAQLYFIIDQQVVIPSGTFKSFELYCQLLPPTYEYLTIQIGFMSLYNHAPSESIQATGMDTGTFLPVNPEDPVYMLLHL